MLTSRLRSVSTVSLKLKERFYFTPDCSADFSHSFQPGIYLNSLQILFKSLNLYFYYRGALREVKKEHPVMMLVGVLSACLIGVYTLGSIAVFILSIALPLLSKCF